MVLPLLLVLYELHPSSTHPYLHPFPVLYHPRDVPPTIGYVYSGSGGFNGRSIVGIGPKDTMVPIGTYTLEVNT